MPTSPHDQSPGVEDVRSYLEAIPDSDVTAETVDTSYSPLLFLHRTSLLAAFAFANGNLPNSYERLYSGFKAQYNHHRDEWADLDLAFIFCVNSNSPNLYRFCSQIETDVFFCRKFVVPLVHPLDAALARLPFLPLVPVAGASFRPPSAQTLLQQCGVPAELSRFIVIQRERSPEGIAQDCVSGRFGEPTELRLKSAATVSGFDSHAAPVRVNSLTIKNFRAYRREQVFNLDSDVTVLYGPNGFGKTSVFDAIDFAITGGIARFESSNDNRFVRTARHLDSESDDGVVLLSVTDGSTVTEITRTVADRKSAHIDGHSVDRKAVLSNLTKATIPAADRIENFVRLFRATHLFSQDQQELAKNFEETCALSEQVVSRMLAFEDYVSAVAKASRVLEIIRREITNSEQEVLGFTSQLAEDRDELERLRPPHDAQQASASLSAELASLQKRLQDVGVSVPTNDLDVNDIRGWRASIEALRADSKSRIERLSALTIETSKLPGTRQHIANAQKEIVMLDQSIAEAERDRVVDAAALEKSNAEFSALTSRRRELQDRSTLLEWVRTIKPEYARRLQGHTEAAQQCEIVVARLTASNEDEARAADALASREADTGQINQRLEEKRGELASVEDLFQSADAFRTQNEQLRDIVSQDSSARTVLTQLQTEYLEVCEKVTANADMEARLSAEIANVDRTQSELKQILSQLQGYIKESSCPLCGHDYKSREELLERINAHVTADEATNARLALLEVQAIGKDLAAQRDGIKHRQQQIERDMAARASSQRALEADIERFRAAAASFGISRDVTGQAVIERLQNQRDAIQAEIKKLQEETSAAETILKAAQLAFSDRKKRVATDASELVDARRVQARWQQELEALTKDPRLTIIPIDIDDQQLEDLIHSNTETIRSISNDIGSFEQPLTQQKAKVAQNRQKIAALGTQLSNAQSELARLQATFAGVSARLTEANLPPDITAEMMNTLIDQESYRHAQLLSLRDSIASMEVAIDAATTSAVHMKLLGDIRAKEKGIDSAKLKQKRHEPWARYFDQLSRLVSSQQNEAIAAFTRQYGPRASVLQQRLRSVYGFGEIEIASRQSEIEVWVKRNGERLRPTDYFSQSQVQTLLLGLFLTACLSQTWSRLAPIFLDDPVTHFDDLNSYSFLDLILGLSESQTGQRQFIISTCDERLLDLARQKFRHIGKRARFYAFTAMGAEGPVVGEIA